MIPDTAKAGTTRCQTVLRHQVFSSLRSKQTPERLENQSKSHIAPPSVACLFPDLIVQLPQRQRAASVSPLLPFHPHPLFTTQQRNRQKPQRLPIHVEYFPPRFRAQPNAYLPGRQVARAHSQGIGLMRQVE